MTAQVQTWNAENYARNARFVSELGLPVLELLNPQPGERILDLGCGDGALTQVLVEAGCDVIGVDSSPDMVAAARALGIRAQVADGHNLPFIHEFDAVFSNAALHWMKDADVVIAGVARALKAGGRFVGEFGGHGNIEKVMTAIDSALRTRGIDSEALNPWYFPTTHEYRQKLERHNFRVQTLHLFLRPTLLPDEGIRGWLKTFAQSFIAVLPEHDRDRFMGEVEERLEPLIRTEDGTWVVDYVRLRFAAFKEEVV
jgi:trans-aconitate methyltransferase